MVNYGSYLLLVQQTKSGNKQFAIELQKFKQFDMYILVDNWETSLSESR
jgi:hypothetical protein